MEQMSKCVGKAQSLDFLCCPIVTSLYVAVFWGFNIIPEAKGANVL